VFGHVRWAAAIPLGIGFLIGGAIGPAIVRRLSATVLRRVIAVAALGLAVYLFVAAAS
jgi:hypothetical protein